MKKALAIILLICFVLCLTACNNDETSSDVMSDNLQIISTPPQPEDNSSQQNLNPSTSSPSSSEETNEQQTTNITLTESKKIAENLVSKYHQYSYLTVCCDTEYNDNYTVCKIACCHSIKEMKEHTLKYLDKSIANKFISENFSDDKSGNIYVVIDGYGILGYGEVSIIEYSSKKIVAKVPVVDIDGPTGAYDVFYIEKKGNDFIITGINK